MTWKIVLVMVGLVGASTGSLFTCHDSLSCNKIEREGVAATNEALADCSAHWGAFPRINVPTNELIKFQIQSSMEYLLISSHFKEWKHNRPGFASYFGKLSDDSWDEALALLNHMVERGGSLVSEFKIPMPSSPKFKNEFREVEALTWALDKEKKTATQTLHLAHLANHGQNVPHDAEFAEFLAKGLHKNSVLRIKHLANYVRLLTDITTGSNDDHQMSYAFFKFDAEYLK